MCRTIAILNCYRHETSPVDYYTYSTNTMNWTKNLWTESVPSRWKSAHIFQQVTNSTGTPSTSSVILLEWSELISEWFGLLEFGLGVGGHVHRFDKYANTLLCDNAMIYMHFVTGCFPIIWLHWQCLCPLCLCASVYVDINTFLMRANRASIPHIIYYIIK